MHGLKVKSRSRTAIYDGYVKSRTLLLFGMFKKTTQSANKKVNLKMASKKTSKGTGASDTAQKLLRSYKQCPDCLARMPLNAKICPDCGLKVGPVQADGKAYVELVGYSPWGTMAEVLGD